MKKIGIYGGAFNPITKGHIQVAQYILNHIDISEIWLTPSYKHMYNKLMASFEDRLHMCNLVSKNHNSIKVFDYEKNNHTGSTYDLLNNLYKDELYKDHDFYMIIGEDNAYNFKQWKNYDKLKEKFKFIVISRQGYNYKYDNSNNWFLSEPHIYLNAGEKVMQISSTNIRDSIICYYKNIYGLDNNVYEYIKHKNLYL